MSNNTAIHQTEQGAFTIRPFAMAEKQALLAFWDEVGLLRPVNDSSLDIDIKMAVQPELLIVGELGGRIAASMMLGWEGHRGWINYLGVLPSLQQCGLGGIMVRHALETLKALGAPKVNLCVLESNSKVIGFYEHLGFVRDKVLCFGYRFPAG